MADLYGALLSARDLSTETVMEMAEDHAAEMTSWAGGGSFWHEFMKAIETQGAASTAHRETIWNLSVMMGKASPEDGRLSPSALQPRWGEDVPSMGVYRKIFAANLLNEAVRRAAAMCAEKEKEALQWSAKLSALAPPTSMNEDPAAEPQKEAWRAAARRAAPVFDRYRAVSAIWVFGASAHAKIAAEIEEAEGKKGETT